MFPVSPIVTNIRGWDLNKRVGLTLEGGTNIRRWDLHKRVGLTLEGGTNIRGWD